MKKLLLVTLVSVAAGCTLERREPQEPIANGTSVLFVADGAGDFRAASRSFRHVVTDEHLPVQVRTVVWSHGFLRVLRDQLDYAHGRTEGVRLAATIGRLKQLYPEMKVYLAGHSAGAVVVVAAAEALPPGSIEGMALLAPSLSSFYDLRPALRAIRGHLDVYYSRRDWGYLGIGTGILGTSDRLRVPPGGRVGFQVYLDTADDQFQSGKLRQHAWHFRDASAGNNGGHYGSYQPRYMRTRVIPLLFEAQTAMEREPKSEVKLGRPVAYRLP